jgi:choline dehydrogenase-like flavoprotein
MPTARYDAVIIGSGITGGWAAKELTEKGLNTLILEAGRPITPEKDYVEHVPVWELKYRDWDDRKERQATQPIQRECYYACDEFSNKFSVHQRTWKTFFLDQRASGRRKVHHLGPPVLSLERS